MHNRLISMQHHRKNGCAARGQTEKLKGVGQKTAPTDKKMDGKCSIFQRDCMPLLKTVEDYGPRLLKDKAFWDFLWLGKTPSLKD